MAKQHMPNPVAADPGPVWLDRDWHQPPCQTPQQRPLCISADTESGGAHYSMDNSLVPEQFVFPQQHWGSCSLNTPRIKNVSVQPKQ